MRLNSLTIRRMLAAIATALAAPGPVQAVTPLATGTTWNEENGSRVRFASNVGTTPVRVNSMKLIAFEGEEMTRLLSPGELASRGLESAGQGSRHSGGLPS
jgi:hypothetical protein